MAWLGTYAHRVKVTASNTNIDADQTHFPLLLTLGTSVGTGNNDVSFVFDELTSDANRLKIAVTKTDGTTELYVEIEKWDDANETAVLWVSKSDWVLDADANTEVYLYYDSAHADNTDRVGDTNSVVAESVWDSSFKMVQHMADGASTSATYDSTSNDNDGTKKGAAEPAVTTGEIGNAQDFDGSDDRINITDSTDFDFTTSEDMTLELWFNGNINDNVVLLRQGGGGADNYFPLFFLQIATGGYVEFGLSGETDGADFTKITGSTDRTDNSWHYLAGVRNTTDDKIYLYLDGASEATAVTDGTTATINSTNYLTIGCYNFGAGNYAGFFTGSIDETRISKAARSAAHIKANYYTQTDALVAWGSEETSKTTYTKTSQVKARVTQADQSATAQAKGRIEQLGISKISQAKARVSQNDNIQTNQTQGRIKKTITVYL